MYVLIDISNLMLDDSAFNEIWTSRTFLPRNADYLVQTARAPACRSLRRNQCVNFRSELERASCWRRHKLGLSEQVLIPAAAGISMGQ
jgi:hypothetical protein